MTSSFCFGLFLSHKYIASSEELSTTIFPHYCAMSSYTTNTTHEFSVYGKENGHFTWPTAETFLDRSDKCLLAWILKVADPFVFFFSFYVMSMIKLS